LSRYGRSRPSRPDEVKRGQVWVVTFEPGNIGAELGKERPAVVISNDTVNASPVRRSTVLPISTRSFDNPLHVQVTPPEGGVEETSFVVCDYQRTVSHDRLYRYLGRLSPATLIKINYRLGTVLGLQDTPCGR